MQNTIAFKCRRIPLLLTMLVMLSVGGCRKGVETIWRAEARSPNGQWLASAQTDQRSGFGTDGAITTLYLTPTNGSRSAVQVLSFSQNEHAQTSLIDLKMQWRDSTHLDVSYRDNPTLDFQAVRYAGIEISIRDLSSGSVSSNL
jgi:hypothetical protein